MADSSKPWNKVGVNNHSADYNNIFNNQLSSNPPTLVYPSNGKPQQAPPVPPRPTDSVAPYRPPNYYTNNYPYNSGGGGYPYGSMNYGGGYSYFGPTNYGGGYYGNQLSDGRSGFAHQAEMSSRPTFQFIESIVRTFSSVSMMMESTYQAVFNSFRAVIGVVDHFSRMQTHLSQTFSTIAIFRVFKWFIGKLKRFFGQNAPGQSNGSTDRAWAESVEDATNVKETLFSKNASELKSSWLVLMYFAIVFGGPWLLWKLITSLNSPMAGEQKLWSDGSAEHYVGVVEFDFEGQRDDEITLRKGTKVIIAPKENQPPIKGWALVSSGNGKVGLVPQNYVKVTGRRSGNEAMVQNQNKQISGQTNSINTVINAPSFDKIFIQSEANLQNNNEANINSLATSVKDSNSLVGH